MSTFVMNRPGCRGRPPRLGRASAGAPDLPTPAARAFVVMDVSLEPGFGHDFHKHPDQDEMIIVKAGRIEQWIGEEQHDARGGRLGLSRRRTSCTPPSTTRQRDRAPAGHARARRGRARATSSSTCPPGNRGLPCGSPDAPSPLRSASLIAATPRVRQRTPWRHSRLRSNAVRISSRWTCDDGPTAPSSLITTVATRPVRR